MKRKNKKQKFNQFEIYCETLCEAKRDAFWIFWIDEKLPKIMLSSDVAFESIAGAQLPISMA